jgi:hypothetical protein
MRRVAKVFLGAGVAALLAIGSVAAPVSAAAPVASASACAKATNIEAIVDDSISMEFTDANRLRVQAIDLLINSLDASTQLGAVEFGSAGFENNPPAADSVFPPQPVGAHANAMKAALDQKIHADNGATDYNGAFAQSDVENPNANARIFLTDGGHDVDTYNEAHLVHNAPTYVIGFGGIAAGEDQARLQKIATDTGGRYFPLKDSSQLQAVMDTIEAALTCQTPPQQFTDLLKQGQSKVHSIAIGAATRKIQIALTWSSPLDKFKIAGLELTNKGHLLAIAGRRGPKPGKLKISRAVGTTYTVLKVSGLHKGQLRFAVRATKIGSGEPKVSLTTQVSQTSHRYLGAGSAPRRRGRPAGAATTVAERVPRVHRDRPRQRRRQHSSRLDPTGAELVEGRCHLGIARGGGKEHPFAPADRSPGRVVVDEEGVPAQFLAVAPPVAIETALQRLGSTQGRRHALGQPLRRLQCPAAADAEERVDRQRRVAGESEARGDRDPNPVRHLDLAEHVAGQP